jgi:transcriptional regulator with XRE-family HTH domain
MAGKYDFKEIGARIRMLRGRERQKDWAKKIGCDQGYISQVENGVTKPSLSFLGAVSAMCSASIDWMLTGKGRKNIAVGAEAEVSGPGGSSSAATALTEDLELFSSLNRILGIGPEGREFLVTLGVMDEERVKSLAVFLGITGK